LDVDWIHLAQYPTDGLDISEKKREDRKGEERRKERKGRKIKIPFSPHRKLNLGLQFS
jgi:hypothetical protein